MPLKSKNDKRREAEAAGRPNLTKAQAHAPKSKKAKKEEQKAKKAAKKQTPDRYL